MLFTCLVMVTPGSLIVSVVFAELVDPTEAIDWRLVPLWLPASLRTTALNSTMA